VIGLELRFLAGRFHGNGWHHAHNEGIPEWPPSPWRVLRALVSAAYAEDLTRDQVEPLLEKLRGLPRYQLPLASDAHTRHYMPDTDDANEKRSKVFDTFVAIDGGAKDPQPVIIGWDVVLDADERALLSRLARRISYLGRAESWAEASVVDVVDDRWSCWPNDESSSTNAMTLLALAPSEVHARWVEAQPRPKKGLDVPRGLWDVLTFDGERFRDEGWSDVPGTQRARYVFDRPPFRRSVVPRPSSRKAAAPTVARYAIRSAVLPRMQDALLVSERLRVSAMSQSKRVTGDAKEVFSGHSSASNNHQHAMYLAASEGGKRPGFVDHLIISARGGFDEDDVVALQRLRGLWGRGGHNLELILVGLGQAADFGGLAFPRSPVLAASRVWESVTPFVPTRHPKFVRGVEVDGIEQQIRRACEQLLAVVPVSVEAIGDRAEWAKFRRHRLLGGGRRGPDRGFGARLTFEPPVTGPIALGYGSHFGLGLFSAVSPVPPHTETISAREVGEGAVSSDQGES
jgi:CRISPR-associated protein Csb2